MYTSDYIARTDGSPQYLESDSPRAVNNSLSSTVQPSKIRKIPIKIIMNDDEEVISSENNSDTTEENSMCRYIESLRQQNLFHSLTSKCYT
jgi:hypothetical protein